MDELAKQKRFLLAIEQGIREANREIIHERIPPITAGNLLPFAVSVARLRARYLEAAFKFAEKASGDQIDDSEVEDCVQRATARAATGHPVIVDVRIDYSRKSAFTKGIVKTNLARFSLSQKARFIGRAVKRHFVG